VNDAERKATPIFSGLLAYFPDALIAVAQVSKIGNDQHNPGEPLHWALHKSTEELESLTRHLVDEARDPGGYDTDGTLHLAKVAWRSLAALQRAIYKSQGKTWCPGCGQLQGIYEVHEACYPSQAVGTYDYTDEVDQASGEDVVRCNHCRVKVSRKYAERTFPHSSRCKLYKGKG